MGDDRPRDEWSWEDADHFGRESWHDEDEDEDEDGEGSDYWQAEDSALESSLFGDC